MSDAAPLRRIRVQTSPADDRVMGFVLDEVLGGDAPLRFDAPDPNVPLIGALFGVGGVERVEITGHTIWIRRAAAADWAALKPAIAAAIRQVPELGAAPVADVDEDAALLRAVEELLDTQVNPSVASHGGHIAAVKVSGGVVHLRMSGGCQGCAASAATLRDGVERMLRAALPAIRAIVDVTDHSSGETPYYAPANPLHRPVPPGVIEEQDGSFIIDPDYLAPRLGLTPEALQQAMREGAVVSTSEAGTGADAGKVRITLRHATRAWAAEIAPDGSAREVPPPRATATAAKGEEALADKLRAHLLQLGPEESATYGVLARAMGLWAPGSVRKVTAALEHTMRQDAEADRPFIAARAISRAGEGLPGLGFFHLAKELGRGPGEGEDERAFHTAELARLTDWLSRQGQAAT
ncbi:MAG: NifU family protein [Rubellimicrobium sp.]|nr:NifU family protein [Rubellimicrobium sp.]